jgi:hypothetical protein
MLASDGMSAFRRWIRVALPIMAGVWLLFVAGIYVMMRQQPETFAAGMARMPGPLFLVLPFETLWFQARGGVLQVGSFAPDFDLDSIDHKQRVKLSDFRGKKPVVLIFGSYT